jgi:hypothetical protein
MKLKENEKLKKIYRFFLGLGISFSVSVIAITIATGLNGGESIQAVMIYECLGLASCSALAGAVFSSEKLDFKWQLLLTYISVLGVLILFANIFKWYDLEGNWTVYSFFTLLIGLYTVCFLVTAGILAMVRKRKDSKLNRKLKEYQDNYAVRKEKV